MNNLELQQFINLNIHKPDSLQETIFDYMEENLNGELRIVDPTNPYMLVIESIVATGVSAVDHNLLNLSKRYSVLCTDEDELYPHLNIGDLDDAHALPSTGLFTVRVNFDVLKRTAILSTDGLYSYAAIPKDTIVHVDGTDFIFSHELQIRLYGENAKIIIVPSEDTDIQRVSNTVLTYYNIYDANQYRWIQFDTTLTQLTKKIKKYDLTKSVNFTASISIDDSFHKLKAYHLSNGNWIELPINYNLEVFDATIPELSVRVTEDSVELFIIPIYGTLGLLGESLKVILYTTKGSISLDMSSVNLEKFETELLDLDDGLDVYAKAFNKLSYTVSSIATVTGGRSKLSFAELKYRHLERSFGPSNLPITENNLVAATATTGNLISKYVNTVAGRLFVSSSSQPLLSTAPYHTEVATGYVTIDSSFAELSSLDTVMTSTDGKRVTVLPTTIYRNDQLSATIEPHVDTSLWSAESKELQVTRLNSADFRYSPWYYVYEQQGDSLIHRAYQMDVPTRDLLSFDEHNVTSGYYINSESMEIGLDPLNPTNYLFNVVLAEDGSLNGLDVADMYVQLRYQSVTGEYMYLSSNSGSLVTGPGGVVSRVLSFTIMTSMDINSDNYIEIVNGKTASGILNESRMALDSRVELIYCSTSVPTSYESGPLDQITMQESLLSHYYPIVKESLQLTLGTELTGLWSDIRPISSTVQYQHATADSLLRYTEPDVELVFGTGCNIVSDIIHNVGDPQLDSSLVDYTMTDVNDSTYVNPLTGMPNNTDALIYQFRIGDLLLDENGAPIPESVTSLAYKFTMMCLSYKEAILANVNAVEDREAVLKNIVTESTTEIDLLEESMLTHSDVYYKPSVGSGPIKIQVGVDAYSWLEARVRGTIYIRCEESIFKSDTARELLKVRTYATLDSYLKKGTLDRQELSTTLTASYDEGVTSVTLDLNLFTEFDAFQVTSPNDRFTVDKLIELDQYGKFSLTEDIQFEFINFTRL